MLKWKKKMENTREFQRWIVKIKIFHLPTPLFEFFHDLSYISSPFSFFRCEKPLNFGRNSVFSALFKEEKFLPHPVTDGSVWTIGKHERGVKKVCVTLFPKLLRTALNVALSVLSPNVSLTSVCIRLYPFVLDILFHNSCYCSRIIATKLSCS